MKDLLSPITSPDVTGLHRGFRIDSRIYINKGRGVRSSLILLNTARYITLGYKMKKLIRFKFDPEKFVNILAYLASKSSNLTKLKAAKLLYLVDKEHISNYGRPVIGDSYVRMDYGPAPSKALDIINDVLIPERVQVQLSKPNVELFKKYLRADYTSKHPTFKSVKQVDWDIFSESEVEALQKVTKSFANKSATFLINLTHKDPTWLDTDPNSDIDYRLFLEGLSHDRKKEMIQLMESDQEDREIFDL